MKRVLIALAVLFTSLVILGLTEGRIYAMHVYGAPCSPMSGFAGLLQKTHFLPAGSCAATPGVGCNAPGTACNINSPVSGSPKNGKCTTVDTACVCK